MSYNLKRYGKWCLVTGASSGLGLEFARLVAGEGLNLILVARRRERLEVLAEELRQRYGVETRVIVQDLGLAGAAEQVSREVEPLEVDLLVLNAGFGYYGRFVDMAQEEIARMVALNCTTVAQMARSFLPGMLQRRRGAVIIVSSVLGFLPGPFISLYSGTKAFDLNFGESLRPELKKYGVDLLNLCPAGTQTEFHEVASRQLEQSQSSADPRRDDPRKIVGLALATLGRRGTVYPRQGRAASLATRLLSRDLVAWLTARVMAKRKNLDI